MPKSSKGETVAEVLAALREMQTDQDLFDDLAAERLGINRTDLRVLDVISQTGPIGSSELAERAGLSRPALTTAIDRLEAVDYVRRVRSTVDRRQVVIEFTAKVERLAAEIWGPFGVDASAEVARFPRAELEATMEMLRRLGKVSAEHRRRLGDSAPPPPQDT